MCVTDLLPNSGDRRFCDCIESMLAKWHIVRVNYTDPFGRDVSYRFVPMAQ